ncbi:hypothetical protein D3C78_1618410 [compost metagenome]
MTAASYCGPLRKAPECDAPSIFTRRFRSGATLRAAAKSSSLMVCGTTRSAVPCMNSMGVCMRASLSTESKGCVTKRPAPGTLPQRRVPSMAPMLVKLDSTIRPAKSGCSGRAARSMAMAPPRLCPYTKRRAASG